MIDMADYKCIGMYRVLAEITDSVDGAVFLSQLMYWDKHVDNQWFYKTRDEWYFETAIKKDRQITLCKQLKQLGILETQIKGIPARTHYRLNRQQLQHRFEMISDSDCYRRSKKRGAAPYYQKSNPSSVHVDLTNQVQAIPTTNRSDPLDNPLSETPEQGVADPHNQLTENPTTGQAVSPQQVTQKAHNQVLGKATSSHSKKAQPAVALSSSWVNPSSGKPTSSHGDPYNWVLENPATGQATCPQLDIQEAHNWLPEKPTPYKEKNTHESTHENRDKNTHENTHQNTFVEFVKKSDIGADGENATDGQLSATELHHCQTSISGNSPQAARRGGDEPESLNQSSQAIATPSNDVAHQETDVGAQHLQCLRENLALSKKPDDRVADIFSHWQTVMAHPNAKLDAKRKRLIRAALKMGYTADALKQAITGCGQTPHNLGDNDRGQRYDGLHIILRDADQIDRFMRNAVSPPKKMNAQEQLEANNKRVADAWLYQQGLSPVGETTINPGEL